MRLTSRANDRVRYAGLRGDLVWQLDARSRGVGRDRADYDARYWCAAEGMCLAPPHCTEPTTPRIASVFPFPCILCTAGSAVLVSLCAVAVAARDALVSGELAACEWETVALAM